MDLKSYIRPNLKKGYSESQLRAHLISQGYPQSAVDNAFRSIKLNAFLAKSTIALLVLIAVVSFLLWLFWDENAIKEEAGPKEMKEVMETREITRKEDPEEVSEAKIAASMCPQGCNDFDACTSDLCVNGICQNAPIRPCCGNLECEVGENEMSCPADCRTVSLTREEAAKLVIERAISSQNRDQALNICRSLPSNQEIDQCIYVISKTYSDSSMCGKIIGSNKRDSCYLDFALSKRDFSVCEKLEDRWLRQSCFSYKGIQEQS